MIKTQTIMKPYPILTTVISGNSVPSHLGYQPKFQSFLCEVLSPPSKKPMTPSDGMKKKLVQTMFRESEAQTDPYEVEIVEPDDKGLEILTLGWLSWNNGLPAGMHEIQIIERARQRRAWEKAAPLPFDQYTMEMRKMVLEAMEINEWNFREEEILAVGSLRMELAEKMMKENRQKCNERMDRYIRLKVEEKKSKIQKTRLNFHRNLRKLICLRDKVVKKYHKLNIVKEHCDKTSEFYGPQMRFGEDPRRRHEVIKIDCRYRNAFNNLEVLKQSSEDIFNSTGQKPAFDYESKSKPKKYTKELCVRETKWTERNLEQLYNELKSLRLKKSEPFKPCPLKVKIPPPPAVAETPRVRPVPDHEEELYQSSLILQKTIKGRAIQAAMFEGRVRCQELLEEMKSTHALQNYEEETKGGERRKIFELQRETEINNLREKRKQEIIQSLHGKTIGEMLDFLSKELLRLQDERLTHAFALLADRERHKREAAEAGRRQQEDRRGREHAEMYKQIIKLHQNVVDIYFEDVIIENTKWLAERSAREYVHETAKKIDRAATETHQRANLIEEQEIIADLVHNYALPEAQKQLVRQRLNDKQRNYLKICHSEVYSNIERLVHGPRTPKGELVPLPRPKKHKVPSLIPIKFLRLGRSDGSGSTSFFSEGSERMSFQKLKSTDSFPFPFPFQPMPIIDEDEKSESNGSSDDKDGRDNENDWSCGFSKQDVVIKQDL